MTRLDYSQRNGMKVDCMETWDGTVYQIEGRKAKLTLSDEREVIGYGLGIADASTDDLDMDGIVFRNIKEKSQLMIYTADDIISVDFIE